MMEILGQLAGGRPFVQKLTKRTKKIRIDQKDLVEIDLSALAELPTVTELYLRAGTLRSVSLEPLASTSLTMLKLVAKMPALSLVPLDGLALTELMISGGPPSLDLSPLARCTSLEDLFIFEGPLTSVDLAPLAACKQLQVIWLRSLALRELDLQPLAKLPHFRAAVLDGSKLETVTLGDTGFAALTNLDLTKNPLATVSLGALQTSKTIKSIRVPKHFTMPFESKAIEYS